VESADADLAPFAAFAIALFIGALVGLERELRQDEEIERGERAQRGIGGLRTFILFAQAGAIAAWLSHVLATPVVFVGVGALVAAIVLAGYLATSRQEGQLGLTTEVAAIVTYLLGGTVVFGYAELAVALAIATSAVLAFKKPLHGAVERIGREDLYAGLKLLIATFIVLPVLPNRALDPWGALNPWQMWWLVILISGLSLVGYGATRWLGAGHGIPLTGLLGGLASSTAVTLELSRRSAEQSGARLADALAAGILLAWATMFARIGVLVAAVNAPLLRPLALPLGVGLVVTAGFAAWHHQRGHAASGAVDEVPLTNPFSLTSAIRFALLFAVVLLAVRLVETYLPASGLYAVAALAGVTDVDAITLSVAQPGGATGAAAAVASIAIAAASNTAVKCGMTFALGAPALARRIAVATAALLAVVAVAVLLTAR
jgi:uncharacterized membrane protein (DUF4010 family)